MPYTLPKLPYEYDALEPFISRDIMHVHYDKHHQAYCDNTNKQLAGTPWADRPIEEVLKNLDQFPDDKRTAVRNHGGGFFNHSIFWTFMGPQKGGKPGGELAQSIDQTFGSFDSFQEKFTAAAVGQFGSGWAWLVLNAGKLEIMQTANQDSPVSAGKTPLFAIDVWEHSYYLQYQNRRPDYVAAFWNVANWDEVASRYASAKQ